MPEAIQKVISSNVGLMLVHRPRRWPNIKTTLAERPVLQLKSVCAELNVNFIDTDVNYIVVSVLCRNFVTTFLNWEIYLKSGTHIKYAVI